MQCVVFSEQLLEILSIKNLNEKKFPEESQEKQSRGNGKCDKVANKQQRN